MDTLSVNNDILREVRNTFIRTNILLRKFSNCSNFVKSVLFRHYCLCFYDTGLWWSYNVTILNKFRSCYNRCVKLFFGFKRCDSLSQILINFNIPSFDTVLSNARYSFQNCCKNCLNPLLNCFT